MALNEKATEVEALNSMENVHETASVVTFFMRLVCKKFYNFTSSFDSTCFALVEIRCTINFNNFNNVVGNGSWDGYLCQSGVAEVPASAFRLCCMMLRCDIGVEAKSAIVQVCSELKHAQSELKDNQTAEL
ncbi:Glucose-6-phosphate isomerase [Trichinella spiralis]|uniref:Glucose-6-phosphate isomerase n=1 Tax=Trichinella spiralis TaxID=6334 RepID=A0ABR3KI92_TRISP